MRSRIEWGLCARRISSLTGVLLLAVPFWAGCENGETETETETESATEARGELEGGTIYAPSGQYAGIGRVLSAGGESCTGTLVSNWAVLTAGHCVSEGESATFILTGGRGSIAGTATRHPLWNQAHWLGYDYAIIRFPHSIFDDSNVTSTGLVPFQISDQVLAAGDSFDWYGMGNYGADCSQFTSLTVTRLLGQSFSSVQDDWQYLYESSQKGLCSGDSGGPILSGGAVAGVNSWRQGDESAVKPTYMAYSWIRENIGRPDLPGDTWGHCVYYPTWIGPTYLSTQGNSAALTGTWDNSISSLWVEKGYRTTLYDGTQYAGTQLGSYNGFLGATGNCNEHGCAYDLAGTAADNKASSAKCESELEGDTWGWCVLYHRYMSGNYLSIQGNLPNFDAYPEWNDSAAQIWVERGRHAELFPLENYEGGSPDPNGSYPYWSSRSYDGITGDWCNQYGCLHDLTGTVAERTASSIKCY